MEEVEKIFMIVVHIFLSAAPVKPVNSLKTDKRTLLRATHSFTEKEFRSI